MRVAANAFFYPRVVGEGDGIILDCYWLAKWYSQSPETFLQMPLTQVRLHMERTSQMAQRMAEERDANE